MLFLFNAFFSFTHDRILFSILSFFQYYLIILELKHAFFSSTRDLWKINYRLPNTDRPKKLIAKFKFLQLKNKFAETQLYLIMNRTLEITLYLTMATRLSRLWCVICQWQFRFGRCCFALLSYARLFVSFFLLLDEISKCHCTRSWFDYSDNS